MSAWHNSPRWRPPQFGWFASVEFVSFLAWFAPTVAGAFLIAVDKAATGGNVQWPQHLDQLGLFSGYFSATMLYAPPWGFPAIAAAFPLRLILLNNGWFGWTSTLIAGAIAGILVPVMLGLNLSLVGPLYGANYLWMQYLVYKARYPAFDNPYRRRSRRSLAILLPSLHSQIARERKFFPANSRNYIGFCLMS